MAMMQNFEVIPDIFNGRRICTQVTNLVLSQEMKCNDNNNITFLQLNAVEVGLDPMVSYIGAEGANP
jgi:hypothetical protein